MVEESVRKSATFNRALTTALVVGPILTVINQTTLWGQLLRGAPVPAVGLIRIARDAG